MFHPLRPRVLHWLAAAALMPGGASAAKIYYSKPSLSKESVGLVQSKVDGYWYRGSGTVAYDPKLIISCGHVFYDSGKWATDYTFHRAWHAKGYPRRSQGVAPRGLSYFTSYVDACRTRGSESNAAFASDFTVLYGYSPFGTAAEVWENSGSAIRSWSRYKEIVGYPSEIDYTGASGGCFQHSTGWFTYGAYQIRGRYHEFDDVSTGPGNSGGAIFIYQSTTGKDLFGGVLVSGARRMAGVVALDASTRSLADSSLGARPAARSFTPSTPVLIPDGASSFTGVPIPVSSVSGTVAKASLQLKVEAGSGELEAYLRSPGGKIRWILKKGGGTSALAGAIDLGDAFEGAAANGSWTLFLRNAAGGRAARIDACTLTLTSPSS